MTKMKGALLAFAGALVLAPSAAMAQGFSLKGPDSAWFVGGSVGQSKIDCDTSGVAGASCDDSDTSFRIFGGYQFNKNFAVELGYNTLGEATITAPGVSATVEAKAWDLMAVGILPINQKFSVFGKLGMYKADSDLSGTGITSASDSNTDVTYGIGLQYDFNKSLGVRAEWQQYKKVGSDSTGGDGDVDVMGIGVVWKFN